MIIKTLFISFKYYCYLCTFKKYQIEINKHHCSLRIKLKYLTRASKLS